MLTVACISGLGGMKCGMGHNMLPGAFHTLVHILSGVLIGPFMLGNPHKGGGGRGVMTMLLIYCAGLCSLKRRQCLKHSSKHVTGSVFMAWLAQSERAFAVFMLQVGNVCCYYSLQTFPKGA